MKKIEDNAHYHDILKFEELKATLTAEKAQMKPDSYEEKANIVQAVKKRFNQQEKNYNN